MTRTRFLLACGAAGAAYLALRGLILATNFDAVALQGYELFPMGNLARDLLTGGGFPLVAYCDTHSGGELVTGVLAVPFFAVLGHTYLALKMVPLFLGLGLLAMTALFLARHFSRTAAAIAVLLLAFPPLTMTKLSLMAMGNHFEILFFLSLLFYAYYRWHTGGYRRNWFFAGAFIAGFCLFHNFSSALPLVLLLLVHLRVRGFRHSVRDLAAGLPFFLAGIVPLILVNLGTGGGGTGFLEAKFGGEALSPARIGGRIWDFIIRVLPTSGGFEPFLGMPGALAEAAWITVFLAALAFALARFASGKGWTAPGNGGAEGTAESPPASSTAAFARWRVLPFLLYLPLFTVAYAGGTFRFGGYPHPHEAAGYRYLLTHQYFTVILVSIVAAELLRRRGTGGGRARVAGALLVVLPVAAGLFDFAAVDFSFPKPLWKGRFYAGYFYPQFARGMMNEPYRSRPELREDAIRGFAPRFKARFYEGFGHLESLLAIRPPRKTTRDDSKKKKGYRFQNIDVPAFLESVPAAYRFAAAFGVGAYLREVAKACLRENNPSFPQCILEPLERRPCPEIPFALQGMMLNWEFLPSVRTPAFLKANRRIIAAFPEPCRPWMWQGQGILCGRLLRRGIPPEAAVVQAEMDRVPPGVIDRFLFGLGWGLADGGESPLLPAGWRDRLPRAWKERFHLVPEGFGNALAWIHGPEAEEVARSLSPAPDPAARAALLKGMKEGRLHR